jgi:ABC-2 type transport system ATP-binding protein
MPSSWTRPAAFALCHEDSGRAGLLIALAHRPDLLLLDEPSSGLDPIVRRDILAAIIRTVADEGRTVIFSSHLLDEVERVADQVAFLRQGQLEACDDLGALLSKHRVLTVHFPDVSAELPGIPGVIHSLGEGREWSLLCNGELPAVTEALRQQRAEIVEDRAASLEEIFIGYKSPSK